MLTKKEREEIVERCKHYFYNGETDICRYLVGHSLLDDETDEERCKAVLNCIRDFCDTSNMVELPLDKNGEIIHIGDTMYDGFDREVIVSSIEYKENERNVFVKAYDTKADVAITYLPERLIHKNISKHERLAERLDMVAKDLNIEDAAKQLSDIADELRNLDCGDNDD